MTTLTPEILMQRFRNQGYRDNIEILAIDGREKTFLWHSRDEAEYGANRFCLLEDDKAEMMAGPEDCWRTDNPVISPEELKARLSYLRGDIRILGISSTGKTYLYHDPSAHLYGSVQFVRHSDGGVARALTNDRTWSYKRRY